MSEFFYLVCRGIADSSLMFLWIILLFFATLIVVVTTGVMIRRVCVNHRNNPRRCPTGATVVINLIVGIIGAALTALLLTVAIGAMTIDSDNEEPPSEEETTSATTDPQEGLEDELDPKAFVVDASVKDLEKWILDKFGSNFDMDNVHLRDASLPSQEMARREAIGRIVDQCFPGQKVFDDPVEMPYEALKVIYGKDATFDTLSESQKDEFFNDLRLEIYCRVISNPVYGHMFAWAFVEEPLIVERNPWLTEFWDYLDTIYTEGEDIFATVRDKRTGVISTEEVHRYGLNALLQLVDVEENQPELLNRVYVEGAIRVCMLLDFFSFDTENPTTTEVSVVNWHMPICADAATTLTEPLRKPDEQECLPAFLMMHRFKSMRFAFRWGIDGEDGRILKYPTAVKEDPVVTTTTTPNTTKPPVTTPSITTATVTLPPPPVFTTTTARTTVPRVTTTQPAVTTTRPKPTTTPAVTTPPVSTTVTLPPPVTTTISTTAHKEPSEDPAPGGDGEGGGGTKDDSGPGKETQPTKPAPVDKPPATSTTTPPPTTSPLPATGDNGDHDSSGKGGEDHNVGDANDGTVENGTTPSTESPVPNDPIYDDGGGGAHTGDNGTDVPPPSWEFDD